MEKLGLAAACMTAGLVSAWPGEAQAAPVLDSLQVKVSGTSRDIDQLWFYYMVGNSPLKVPTNGTSLGSLAAGATLTTNVSAYGTTGGWMIAGYYTDDSDQQHLVISTSSSFASSITKAPAQSFAQVFNLAAGTIVSHNDHVRIDAAGSNIGAVAGSEIVWDETQIIDSLTGSDTTSYIYQGLPGLFGTNSPISYGEAALGDLAFNYYTGSTWANLYVGEAGSLVAFSDASVIGNASVLVPEPTSVMVLLGASGLLLKRKKRSA